MNEQAKNVLFRIRTVFSIESLIQFLGVKCYPLVAE